VSAGWLVGAEVAWRESHWGGLGPSLGVWTECVRVRLVWGVLWGGGIGSLRGLLAVWARGGTGVVGCEGGGLFGAVWSLLVRGFALDLGVVAREGLGGLVGDCYAVRGKRTEGAMSERAPRRAG
jgi:hypothetical protein